MAGLVDHYLAMITSEHRDKSKYILMLTALLRPSDDIFSLGISIDDEFDIDLAMGSQEDMLGEVADIKRLLPYQPVSQPSPVMDNETYRAMIKARIARNLWKGNVESMEDVWQTLFGTRIVIQDNQDMTITVTLDPYPRTLQENIIHGLIIPKPQSVRVNCLANFSADVENHISMLKSTVKTIDVYPAAVEKIAPESTFYVAMAMTTTERLTLYVGGI